MKTTTTKHPLLQTTLSLAMLMGSLPAYAVLSDIECFFNAAEAKVPFLLNPPHGESKICRDGDIAYKCRDYNNGIRIAVTSDFESVLFFNTNNGYKSDLGSFSEYLQFARSESCGLPDLEIKENYGQGGFRPAVHSNEYEAWVVFRLMCFDKKTNQETACDFHIAGNNSAIRIVKEGSLTNIRVVDYLLVDSMDFTVVAYKDGAYAEKSYTIHKAAPIVVPEPTPTPTPVTCTLPQVLTNGVCVTPTPTPPPVSTSNLLDTGITSAQCYAAGSDALVSCTSVAAIALNDKQDGMVGLDVTSPSNADGKLGFSYSTVGSYPLTDCVKDNRTGLVWEGKPTTGVRAAGNTYTNYGDGRAGDASAYVNTVNATSLCGYTDWRLPTATELQSIVDYGVPYPGPTIDTTWFVNTPNYAYWTSTAYVGISSVAWYVLFGYGCVGYSGRGYSFAVRLVR